MNALWYCCLEFVWLRGKELEVQFRNYSPEAWLLVSVVMLPGSEIIPRLKITLLSILEQWFSGVGSVSIAFVRIVMLIIMITYSCF